MSLVFGCRHKASFINLSVGEFTDPQDTASQQEESVALKGHFYGVYLLCSQSLDPRYRGKCYVGFTVNPKRRIRQHNLGCDFGGARKTSRKGPWLMVMIVHGFPNNTVALQFEWAWQQPSLSTRLKMYPELKRKLPRRRSLTTTLGSLVICLGLALGIDYRSPFAG